MSDEGISSTSSVERIAVESTACGVAGSYGGSCACSFAGWDAGYRFAGYGGDAGDGSDPVR